MRRANTIANWVIFLLIFIQIAGMSLVSGGLTVQLVQALVSEPAGFLSRPLAVVALVVPLVLVVVVATRQSRAIFAGNILIGRSLLKAIGLYMATILAAVIMLPIVGLSLLGDSVPDVIDNAPVLLLNLVLSPLFLISSVYFWVAIVGIARRYWSLGKHAKPSRGLSFVLAVVYGVIGVLGSLAVVSAMSLGSEEGAIDAARLGLLVACIAFIVKAMYYIRAVGTESGTLDS